MNEENTFSVIDYCLFGGVLIISCGIGAFMSYIGYKSPEEFFVGNRAMGTAPVAMSLLTSYVSAISILGFTGEIYANGMAICPLTLGGPLAVIFTSYFVLPIIHPLKLISINEYIELRFKSKRLRLAIFLSTFVNAMTISGISLYAATLTLAYMTKLSILTNILLLGSICTIYSSLGGIRAVIWTDVFQLIVMVIGLITIVTIGIVQNGGYIETLHSASKGGRLKIFDMRLSPFVRYTFFNTIAWGFFTDLRRYTTEQVAIQRLCATKSVDISKSVLRYSIIGKISINYVLFTGGIMVYVAYVGCDPMALGLIKKKDQIMPYFVMNKLSFIPGLTGLFVATIIVGSLSTLSSFINSSVALVWKDVFLKFNFFKTASPISATMITKIISLIVGCVCIGIAIIAKNSKGVLEVMMVVTGTFAGPSLGVFLIGFFLPRCNMKGVWTGFIGSTILMQWLAIGSLFYKKPTRMLPFSIDECDRSNFTSLDFRRAEEFNLYTNKTIEDSVENTSSIVSLYQVSQTFYVIFGPLLCIFFAIIVSGITGSQKIEDISPKLISPRVHKFYWTKEKLSKFQENKINQINLQNHETETNLEIISPENGNVHSC